MLQLYCSRSAYIDKFTIYGERHSGTNLLERCIKQTFDLELTYFFGFKHWFGWTKPETITYHRFSLHTLFIGIVRDPYEWIMANYTKPHHYDYTRPLDINTFLTKEWYSVQDRLNYDIEIMGDRNFITNQRYKNIFDMRTTKYKYLSQTMPLIAPNYVLFSYDSFVKNHRNYLNILHHRFNLKKIGNFIENIFQKKYKLDNEIKEIIDLNSDWELEESLGFSKR